jgi:hypothetical protein
MKLLIVVVEVLTVVVFLSFSIIFFLGGGIPKLVTKEWMHIPLITILL